MSHQRGSGVLGCIIVFYVIFHFVLYFLWEFWLVSSIWMFPSTLSVNMDWFQFDSMNQHRLYCFIQFYASKSIVLMIFGISCVFIIELLFWYTLSLWHVILCIFFIWNLSLKVVPKHLFTTSPNNLNSWLLFFLWRSWNARAISTFNLLLKFHPMTS